MKVSVKMIAYNHAPFLEEAIKGVDSQITSFPVELVIGDDASTDGSRQVVEHSLKGFTKEVKTLLREVNVGMVENFFGLDELMEGDYLAFCEGDDYWIDPYKLQKQVDFLEQNPDYALVYTNVRKYVQGVGFSKDQESAGHCGEVLLPLINGSFIPTVSVMVRRSAYNEVRESVLEAVKVHNLRMIDFPLWIELASRYKVHHINDYTSVYRVLEESASHSADPGRQIRFMQSTIDAVSYYAHKLGVEDQVNRGIASKRLSQYRLALIHRHESLNSCRSSLLETRSTGKKMVFYRFIAKNCWLEPLFRMVLKMAAK